MDAVTFLTTVFQYAESGYSQVFALPTTQAKAVPVIDFTDVSAAIQQFQGQNIYFSPGITSEPKNSKLSNPDIIGIPALWADVDIFHPAHAKQNLPRTVEEAYTLIPECLPPSIIVHSGHGLQFWWLLRECWMFDTPEEKQQAQDILTRLQGYVRQRAQAQGWHLDSVQDLCRVMRLPGTVNIKIPSEPVWAQVIDQSDIRYNPSEIDEILPALEQTAAASGKTRTAAFERRPTDGPASYMLQNCMFMQHCQLNAKTLSYGDWLAALTNIVRATDGIQAAHGISALDPDRYKPADTDKKIDEALGAMNPQNCDYVRTALGFQGCPAGGCGVQAPCGWSLGKVPQARAVVRAITVPTAETVYQPDVLQAVAVLEKDAPAEYDQFYQRLSGQVNKNTFKKELAKLKKEQSGLQIIDGGGVADSKGERWLSQTVLILLKPKRLYVLKPIEVIGVALYCPNRRFLTLKKSCA
ncbi:MAG: Superfamily helicase protein [Firmicutes bacterium]|nr:Superfamily helicase protein [Bacillota bacterium]